MNAIRASLGCLLAGTAAFCAAPSSSVAISPIPALQRVGEYRLRTGRYSASAVTDGRAVYVVGGRTDIEIRGDIERFDPDTHVSTVLTNKLLPRFALGAAYLDGRIYVIGGQGNAMVEQAFESTVEVYEISTGRISRAAPLPRARAFFATAAHGGKIYVIGGALGGANIEQTTSVLSYDPQTNEWSEVAPLPTLLETRAAVSTRDAIVLLGGYRRPAVSTGTRSALAYLPESNRWQALPALAQPVSANSAALLGHVIYLFGNFDPDNEIQAYDIHSGASLRQNAPLDPASQSTAVELNGMIYVVGGTEGGGRNVDRHHGLDTIQVFTAPAR